MKIENSQMLQNQMDIGSNFKLDNQGNIKTQGKIGAFFQSIGDKFRSAETINARNANLMVAMGTMLRHGANPAPLNGPQNLAAPPAMNAQERASLIQDAQKALMKREIGNHIEATYGQQPAQVKDSIHRYIATHALDSRPKNMTELKQAMSREIRNSEGKSEYYATNLAKCSYFLAKNTEELTPQRESIANALKQSITEDIGRNDQFSNNTYDSYIKDSDRTQPAFNGVQTTQQNFATALTQFSQNPVEERMIGYMASQTATFSFLASVMGVGNPPLSEVHTYNPANSLNCTISNAGIFSITREENGDVLIAHPMKGNAQGFFNDEQQKYENLGSLDYTIRLPHEQFAAFANANEELAQLGTQEEKDAYMTGILQNFEPQVEISEMTLTPPHE